MLEAVRERFPFIYDLYEAYVWEPTLCDAQADQCIIGVLMPFEYEDAFSKICDMIHEHDLTLFVCWSDPAVDPHIQPEDETLSPSQAQVLSDTWPRLFQDRLRLMSVPDVTGVSLDWIDGNLSIIVYVYSLAFRPIFANPIPMQIDGLPVIFRVAVFRSRSTHSRVGTFQRLYCSEASEQFSVGGLVRKDNELFAISCAHALRAETKHIYKLEQIEDRGKTADAGEVVSFQEFPKTVGSFLLCKTETLYGDLSRPFGDVIWSALDTFGDGGPGVDFVIEPDALTLWEENIKDLYGIDASLIQLRDANSTFYFHPDLGERLPHSGNFACPRFNENYFTIGSKHYFMYGRVLPIDTLIHTEDRFRISRINKNLKITQSGTVLMNQIAFSVMNQKERTYYDDSDNGNSGSWIFHAVSGDATAVYSASTLSKGDIVVASPLVPILNHIKAYVPGWQDWNPHYVIPGVKPAVL